MSTALVHARVVDHLKRLRLGTLADRLDATLGEAARAQPTYLDFLDQLLRDEMAAKQRRRIEMGIQIAHFLSVKTLEEFDFKFQPSIDAKLVRELAMGRFISGAENVLFFGPPAWARPTSPSPWAAPSSRLATPCCSRPPPRSWPISSTARPRASCQAGCSSTPSPSCSSSMELGYMPLERQSAHLFFQLISHRYEKASMLI
jgi:DNA replication protein DnaC